MQQPLYLFQDYPFWRPSPRYRDHVEEVGTARHETGRRLGYKHYDANPTIMMDINGYAGEVAAGLYYKVPWNEKTDGRDPGWDIMVGGLRVDVKTCMRMGADWVMVYDEQWPTLAQKCDVLLMARADWPDVVQLCAWVTVDRFIHEHRREPVVASLAHIYGPKRLMRLGDGLEHPRTLGKAMPARQLSFFGTNHERSNPCPTSP